MVTLNDFVVTKDTVFAKNKDFVSLEIKFLFR